MSEQGIPVEIKFGTRTDILYVHPDGVIVGNATQLQLQSEQAQRAIKRVEQIRMKLLGGQLSRDEWEEAQRKLEEQMAEGMAEIEGKLTKGEIDQKEFNESKKTNELIYRKEVASLLNQRDGEPVSLEENNRLQAELEGWLKLASFKPFAVPMLKSCILNWTIEKSDENGRATGEPLPISFDSLQSLPEDFIFVAFLKVAAHYKKDAEKEKKPTETSPSPSQTPKANLAESQNGFRSLELPEPTELTLTGLASGESENSTAHSQN